MWLCHWFQMNSIEAFYRKLLMGFLWSQNQLQDCFIALSYLDINFVESHRNRTHFSSWPHLKCTAFGTALARLHSTVMPIHEWSHYHRLRVIHPPSACRPNTLQKPPCAAQQHPLLTNLQPQVIFFALIQQPFATQSSPRSDSRVPGATRGQRKPLNIT